MLTDPRGNPFESPKPDDTCEPLDDQSYAAYTQAIWQILTALGQIPLPRYIKHMERLMKKTKGDDSIAFAVEKKKAAAVLRVARSLNEVKVTALECAQQADLDDLKN